MYILKFSHTLLDHPSEIVWLNFLAEKTSLAAAFNMDWRRFSETAGESASTELQ